MTESNPTNSDQRTRTGGGDAGSTSIIGRVFGGDFEIRRKIGQGGMGTVYEAWQISLNRLVAIKVLANSHGLTPSAVVRFQREAQAAAKLRHPNIVQIFAQGEHEGLYYYAMELVKGRGLNEIIGARRQGGTSASLEMTETKLIVGGDSGPGRSDSSGTDATVRVPVGVEVSALRKGTARAASASTAEEFERMAELLATAADALDYAHNNGVIHRDIKPHNFMHGDDGRLYVMDFGLARVLEQPGMTMTGEFIGSPLYMSPEQIAGIGKDVDHRTDIYSLGATMYEWMTCQPPFPGETREQVITRIVTQEPVAPRALNRAIPIDLETICLKALEKSPRRRYASAQKMAEDLRRFSRKELIKAKREGVFARAGKLIERNRAAALVAGIAIAVLSIMWASQTHRERGRRRELIEAAKQDTRQLTQRIENLEAERSRLAERLSQNLGLESAVSGMALDLVSSVASGAMSAFTGPVPHRVPTPAVPANTDEALAFAEQNVRLLGLVADEIKEDLRRAAAARPFAGKPEDPDDAFIDEYYREAFDAQNLETALGLVNLTLQKRFDHFDALLLRCILHIKASHFAQARDDVNLFVRVREEAAAGHVIRGLLSLLTGDYAVSIEDLDRAVRLDARWPSVWAARGAGWSRQGQYELAFADFDQALELAPEHRAATEERQAAYVSIRRSIRDLTKVVEDDPDNYDALVRLGDLHFLLGEFTQAMDDYRQANRVVQSPSPYLLGQQIRTQQKLNELAPSSSNGKRRSSGPRLPAGEPTDSNPWAWRQRVAHTLALVCGR
ncbi:MAG: protein kinase [Phycisphaerae bacterium]